MKKIIETMSKGAYQNYFTDGIKNWGDQIDVYVSHTEKTDSESNELAEVVMVRLPNNEFTTREDVLAKAEIQDYNDAEILKEKNEELKQGLIEANDMIAELCEEA